MICAGRRALVVSAVVAGCHPSHPVPSASTAAASRYLFVWAGDADKQETDFLAVVDVDRQSPTYAQVVTTLPVGAVGTMPHHTEYEMPADGVLWANGFAAGRTFRLDLRDPARPRVAALLHTVLLPPGPFSCGLYRLRGIEGDTPSAEWVYSVPWEKGRFCAVPVVAGRYWLQTIGVEHSVVSLDVSDPDHPRTAGRLTLGPEEVPHWIALEPAGKRLVITGYRELAPWVLLADFDPATGSLRLDSTFRANGADRPGVHFGRDEWPHGTTGPAVPHGAVFARP